MSGRTRLSLVHTGKAAILKATRDRLGTRISRQTGACHSSGWKVGVSR
jgi:hypothetical protein